MKKLFTTFSLALLALASILYSCSDDYHSIDDLSKTNVEHNEAPDLIATLSPQQKENLEKTGEIFLPSQRKSAWKDTISDDIPVTWGLFDSPIKPQTRAAGIWGYYPAQYWTMVRLKTAVLSSRVRDAINLAVYKIESSTNVRFYNSQHDPKIDPTYNIELPNVYICYSNGNNEGSGSFGLAGGEQLVRVPKDFDDRSKYSDEQVVAFLMHAFCNAAGMFNEQQRPDRDSWVRIYSSNIKDGCTFQFTKQTSNYITLGSFDYNSITMASSKAYSKNGNRTIEKISGGEIAENYELSPNDITFLNDFYLPFIARKDIWIELDKTVYYNGRILTESERLQYQRQLNQQRGLYGDPPPVTPIERAPW